MTRRSDPEFKKELFHRYDEYQKKRTQKRNRVIAAAVPLAAAYIIIMLILFPPFPQLKKMGESDSRNNFYLNVPSGEEKSNVGEVIPESSETIEIITLEVILPEKTLHFTDPVKIKKMVEFLSSLFLTDGKIMEHKEASECRIVLKDADGKMYIYFYKDVYIRDENGSWLYMGEEQRRELDQLIEES